MFMVWPRQENVRSPQGSSPPDFSKKAAKTARRPPGRRVRVARGWMIFLPVPTVCFSEVAPWSQRGCCPPPPFRNSGTVPPAAPDPSAESSDAIEAGLSVRRAIQAIALRTVDQDRQAGAARRPSKKRLRMGRASPSGCFRCIPFAAGLSPQIAFCPAAFGNQRELDALLRSIEKVFRFSRFR